MHRSQAIAWVVSVCASCLRLSQAKTLSVLVASALHVQRISLANIGRHMLGTTKHQIKRCGRFCVNDRIEPADAMRPLIARLLKKRKKKLLIAVDWVDIKGYQSLGQHDRSRLRRPQEPQRLCGSIAADLARHDPAADQGRDPGRPGLWAHGPGHLLPAAGLWLRDPHPAVGHGAAQGVPRQAAGLPGEEGDRQGAQACQLPQRRGRHPERGGPPS